MGFVGLTGKMYTAGLSMLYTFNYKGDIVCKN